MPHFRHDRPRGGYCLLDFYELWLVQALRGGDADAAARYAAVLAHYARAMHPELKEP